MGPDRRFGWPWAGQKAQAGPYRKLRLAHALTRPLGDHGGTPTQQVLTEKQWIVYS